MESVGLLLAEVWVSGPTLNRLKFIECLSDEPRMGLEEQSGPTCGSSALVQGKGKAFWTPETCCVPKASVDKYKAHLTP